MTDTDTSGPPARQPGGNIDRLPQWAQRYIGVLRGDAAAWKAKATAGPDTSDTVVHHHGQAPDQGLGMAPTIRFTYGHHTMIEARRQPDGLMIRTIGGGLVVRPEVSNSVTVAVEPY